MAETRCICSYSAGSIWMNLWAHLFLLACVFVGGWVGLGGVEGLEIHLFSYSGRR